MARRGRTRGSKERSIERRLQTLRYRLKGYSFNRIAEILKISNAQAFRDVQEALQQQLQEGRAEVEELRELESQRYDELWKRLWARLKNADGTLNLDVVDRLQRLANRRADLHGLDKPVKQSVGIDWTKEAESLGADEKEARAFISALADEIVARRAGANAEGSSENRDGKVKAVR